MRNVPSIQGSLDRVRRGLYVQQALLLLAGVAFAACTEQASVVIHTQGAPVTVPVEVAGTPEARTRGLMYRRDLRADAGMLFVFPTEGPQSFWMKNTPLPLDMIFIGADRRIVGIVADTTPFSLTPRGVDAPSQYVLEVHAGFAAQHGIRAGDRVEFRSVPAPVK